MKTWLKGGLIGIGIGIFQILFLYIFLAATFQGDIKDINLIVLKIIVFPILSFEGFYPPFVLITHPLIGASIGSIINLIKEKK